MNKRESFSMSYIMDMCNKGLIIIGKEKKIKECNEKAKELLGLCVSANERHDRGTINPGDIVVLATSGLGTNGDDITLDDLKFLNISEDIRENDLLLAIGRYKTCTNDTECKFVSGTYIGTTFKLEKKFKNLHLSVVLNTQQRLIDITVNGEHFLSEYYGMMSSVLVLDGITGNLKFYKGSNTNLLGEKVSDIMNGKEFEEKPIKDIDHYLTDRSIEELICDKSFNANISEIINEKKQQLSDTVLLINSIPVLCNIVPIKNNQEIESVAILLESTNNYEKKLEEINELIRQIQNDKQNTIRRYEECPINVFNGFIGESDTTHEIKYLAYKASKNHFNVIITGESGTGKSKLAREIHETGDLKGPFIEVNCNAIAPSLFESELFGYVRGAFTGAKNEGKIGLIEAANGGTLFLDEIGEIPMDMQVKLLSVLQNKTIYKVGSTKPIKVDVRIIAATNKELEEEVRQGNFRQDLYYRINVFPIDIPPIRDRKTDLFLLINQLLRETCINYGMDVKRFSGEALQRLISYNWPGNVRELQNVIERAVTLCESNIIYSEHLRLGEAESPKSMKELLAKEEARILEMTLLKNNGDKVRTMNELDISRSIFYEKIKLYNIKINR